MDLLDNVNVRPNALTVVLKKRARFAVIIIDRK